MRMPEVADTALDQYELVPPVRLFPLLAQGNSNATVGVSTGSGAFVLKVYSGYDDPNRLRGEHQLLVWLEEQGLSFDVPVPLRTRTGSLLARSGPGWQAITPLFGGDRVDPTDERDLESFAAALGELLAVLEHFPQGAAAAPASEFHVIVPQSPDLELEVSAVGLDDTPQDRALLDWLQEELAILRRFVESDYQTLPRQLTHNDFIPSNVLSSRGRVTAVLDFEFVTHGVRALDVAMALLFCLRFWVEPDPRHTATVLGHGYVRTNTLTTAEIEALPLLLRLRNLASTLWWLGRAMKAGGGRTERVRIERTREFATWLATWDVSLVEAIAAAMS